jgi:alpha-1,2-mannosyltransferase
VSSGIRGGRRSFDVRVAAQVTAVCGCAFVVWVLFLRRVAPVDLFVFLRAGRAVARGDSPYVDPSSASLWSGHAFVYPYLVTWFFIPFSVLSAAMAGLVYYLGSVAALVATVRMIGGPGAGPVPIIMALTAEPVVRALQLGTLNVWLLFGLAIAWRYRDRAVVLIFALTAVIIAKLFLLPMLAWLLLTRRVRASATTALLCSAAVVLSCGLADQSLGSFARMLSVLSEHEAPHSSSVTALFQKLGAGSALAMVAALVAAAVVVAAGWTRFHRTRNEAFLFCACILASIVASPIVWSHYFALLVLIPLTLHWQSRAKLIVLGVTWLVGTPVGVPALRLLHPFPGAGWICGATAVFVALVWRYGRRPTNDPMSPARTTLPDQTDSRNAFAE